MICGATLLSLICSTVAIGVVAIASRRSLRIDSETPTPSLEVPPDSFTWSQWRGSDSTSVDCSAAPPEAWSLEDDLEWELSLAGKGLSAPVSDGNVLYVTNAYPQESRQTLLAVDLSTGNLLWETTVHVGHLPAIHEKNSHASATPAVTGSGIVTAFAVDDAIWVSSVSKTGEINWQTEAGPFRSHWGYGSSPTRFGNLVIVAGESRGAKLGRLFAKSFLSALDQQTGEIVWRIPRPEDYNYGSPVVAQLAGRWQLLQAGLEAVTSFDPATGETIWYADATVSRSANTVAFSDSMVFSSSTHPSPELLAILADRTGDVTETKIAWRTTRGCADVPTPLVYRENLFVLSDNGILTVYDHGSGDVRKRARLAGNYSASPCIAGNQMFVVSEEGKLSVLSADSRVARLFEIQLPGHGFTNPIFVQDRIVLRTMQRLICIRKSSRKSSQHEQLGPEPDSE